MIAWFGLLAAGIGIGGTDPMALADLGSAPAVELTDTRGRTFRLQDLKGKAVLVSFVYTTCNGVCPATTHNLYRVQEELRRTGLWGTHVAFVSISLDPERDTPEVLARYAELYGCDVSYWTFLTGTPAQIQKVLAEWDLWVRRDPNGVLDHPSRIFLLDPRGHQREIYNLDFLKPASVREDVQGLIEESLNPDPRR